MLNGPSGEEKRNKIRCCRLHGEANSAPLETFLEEWRKLQDYTLNIFNANEAELFFRMASNQTLASAPTSGTKLDRTRITVLLATNAIGTQISNHLNKINVNAQAWNLVKAEPIVNCWRKTGISPTVNENGDDKMIPTEQPTTDAEIIQLILEEGNEKN
ncbi:hypothetical protein GLOIN_2v1778657 [Rhizophagus irregularis DAOM 181602=DAOM 197198]|uniref:Uncharacterized protein n=1 Tax=Rhizophagus irregularis (strain DAOM 181602 / DAOM 197198 / MUCL 43194) TaxID=747089 RepID=A0A2P4PRR2_RHIID|nr:hypothetical protein GLOIN_2v1778657 [Rhizophagus irregularis DAOM 181602=DAOM 197198]POG68067.1 hypothetical protein GLOIN_2v1778657 [Rhizophagus irregularis DAOM 181602=DAOM 197198]|eukprot:XP_025174933.1 hypothetical protein GLOIN_2v1778657 [Rhizophagus irregularis DAOM 181602=DAOM 197198]